MSLRFGVLSLAIALAAVACGGGGGGSESPGSSSSTGSSSSSNSSSTSSSSSSGGMGYLDEEYLSGGDASIARFDDDAFGQSPAAITSNFDLDALFKQGNFLFRNELNGIGPLLNNPTCQGCHLKDGRGNPPLANSETFTSMLIKLSLGNDADNHPIPDPIYGTQIQSFGLSAIGELQDASYEAALDNVTVTGEAHAFISYEEIEGLYSDGTVFTLRKPVYYLSEAAYGEFSSGLLISPRVAPPMIGLGLLGAIPPEDIIALADEDDANSDGISGRVRYVENNTSGEAELGRYGWKSSTGSVLQQTSNAFEGDLGLTNQFAIDEGCTPSQTSCLAMAETEAQTGDSADVSDIVLASVEFYSRLLAVPQRRGFDTATNTWNADIIAGTEIFENIGCVDCHVRHFETAEAAPSVMGEVVSLVSLQPGGEPIDVLSHQHIWPHSDLLLHDMGGSCDPIVRETAEAQSCTGGADCFWVQRCEGLADGRPDGTASGSEWRTAPLWGLGLTQTVNANAGFLHDGRARTIEEAILWHAGEANNSQQAFINLSAGERSQLLAFLNSL